MSMTLPATAHQAGGLLEGELKPEEEDESWSFGCWMFSMSLDDFPPNPFRKKLQLWESERNI